MRTALFWVVTLRIVVILYRRFGSTYRSHFQGVKNPRPLKMGCIITQKRAVLNHLRPIHKYHAVPLPWARYGNGTLWVNRPLDVVRIGNPHIDCHISNTALVLSIVVSWDQHNTKHYLLYQLNIRRVYKYKPHFRGPQNLTLAHTHTHTHTHIYIYIYIYIYIEKFYNNL